MHPLMMDRQADLRVWIDFLNPVGVLHGAATAYLIDMQVFLMMPQL